MFVRPKTSSFWLRQNGNYEKLPGEDVWAYSIYSVWIRGVSCIERQRRQEWRKLSVIDRYLFMIFDYVNKSCKSREISHIFGMHWIDNQKYLNSRGFGLRWCWNIFRTCNGDKRKKTLQNLWHKEWKNQGDH